MARLIEYVVPTVEPVGEPTSAEIAAVIDEAEAIVRRAEGAGGGDERLTGVDPQDPAASRSTATTTACRPSHDPWHASARPSRGSADVGRRHRTDVSPWARSPPTAG